MVEHLDEIVRASDYACGKNFEEISGHNDYGFAAVAIARTKKGGGVLLRS